MPVFCGNFYSWRRVSRLALFVMLFASAYAVVGRAQTEDADSSAAAAAPPYALYQYSTLTGSGNTVTATRLPIVTASGTIYKNVTIQFNVSSAGILTIASLKLVSSPTPLISGFKAGTYVGPSTVLNGQAILAVSGPGIAPGGASMWTLQAASGASPCTYPTSASWYVGPIANSPWAQRIQKAGIQTTPNMSYGVGSSVCYVPWGDTANGALLGFSQDGGDLSIVSFTDPSGVDHPEPMATITYAPQKQP